MKVELKDLRKHFGRTRAVDGVSFSFESGQVVGFVGPNGAGKTTTMRVLATLEEPTDGDAFFDGVSLVTMPEQARRCVGYVPDHLPSHNDITVHEYLDFFARAYELKGEHRKNAVAEIEEFAGLQTFRDRLIKALSKGMKQRVSLGRALLHDPEVLILDEPAAGLDPRARVELRELLALLAQREKAILISSHILTELTEICNSVVIIEKGQILEQGRISELIERRVPKRTVAIRSLDGQEALHRAILEHPHVESVRIDGAEIHADVSCSEDDCCAMLAALVRDGHRIAEFRQHRADLEDIFMRITKGEVQ